jgi:hypothetical protein
LALQLLDLDGLGAVAQPGEDGGLLRGQRGEGFGELGLGDRLDEEAARGPGLGLRPGGDDGVERLPPAAQVIVGHPAREAK